MLAACLIRCGKGMGAKEWVCGLHSSANPLRFGIGQPSQIVARSMASAAAPAQVMAE